MQFCCKTDNTCNIFVYQTLPTQMDENIIFKLPTTITIFEGMRKLEQR